MSAYMLIVSYRCWLLQLPIHALTCSPPAATPPKCSICSRASISVAQAQAMNSGNHGVYCGDRMRHGTHTVLTAAPCRWALRALGWLSCSMFALALKHSHAAPGMCDAAMRALMPQLIPLVVNQAVAAHTGTLNFGSPLYKRCVGAIGSPMLDVA